MRPKHFGFYAHGFGGGGFTWYRLDFFGLFQAQNVSFVVTRNAGIVGKFPFPTWRAADAGRER
jgi:hypothetical protein